MRIASLLAVAALAACAAPAFAQYGRWDGPLDGPSRSSRGRYADPREGRVEVSRFVGEGDSAALLGHGPVEVSSAAGGPFGPVPQDALAQSDRAPFEAAVVDRLIAAGYDTIHADPEAGQVAELRISREVLVPAEVKRNPVSGTAAMEVGNRGSAYGLGIAVDMTKPRTALLSTRMDARIKDRASGKVLWEGRAQIATRQGDDAWTDGKIADKLAAALFDDLRHPTK